MTPGMVKRTKVDFVLVDQGWAWPEYMSIGQAGIQAVSRPVFRYIGITRIHDNVCQHIHRYAGLTKLLYYAGTGEAGLPDLGSVVWHIGLGYGQWLYLGH
jgi:hypothetical protein